MITSPALNLADCLGREIYTTIYNTLCFVFAVQWLDNASSLDANGINEGDTLLLRKKFFILNDDITEAIEGNNEELKELIYQQVLPIMLILKRGPVD